MEEDKAADVGEDSDTVAADEGSNIADDEEVSDAAAIEEIPVIVESTEEFGETCKRTRPTRQTRLNSNRDLDFI